MFVCFSRASRTALGYWWLGFFSKDQGHNNRITTEEGRLTRQGRQEDMFSSISTEPEKKHNTKIESFGPREICVVVACSRPLLHVRPSPLPPISMPSISLHLDRHKILAALSASGIEMEVHHIPEFTRSSLSLHIEECEEDPDIVVLCGSGTTWDDNKIILEDGFGSADFVDLGNLNLLMPRRPKLLVAVGNFCQNFGKMATDEGVAPVVLIVNDTDAAGSADAYEFLSLVLKGMVRGKNGKSSVRDVFDEVCKSMEEQKRPATYASMYTALRAVAPQKQLPLAQGTCRVLDSQGMAALRARQIPRVFRQLGWDGRSEPMWTVIDSMERNCLFNSMLAFPPSIIRGPERFSEEC